MASSPFMTPSPEDSPPSPPDGTPSPSTTPPPEDSPPPPVGIPSPSTTPPPENSPPAPPPVFTTPSPPTTPPPEPENTPPESPPPVVTIPSPPTTPPPESTPPAPPPVATPPSSDSPSPSPLPPVVSPFPFRTPVPDSPVPSPAPSVGSPTPSKASPQASSPQPLARAPPPSIQSLSVGDGIPPSRSSSKTAIIGAVVGAVLGLFFLLTLFAYLYVKKKKVKKIPMTSDLENEHQRSESPAAGVGAVAAVSTNPINTPERTLLDHYSGSVPSVSSSFLSSTDGPKQPLAPLPMPSKVSSLSYEEIAAATQDFAVANFLGQGGFGYVHRGVLLDGTVVAVKQLKAGSRQGEHEFRTEVEIISRVHHRHLVSLIGYCIQEKKRLLVYEFVPNNTLDFHLHGKGKPTLEWSTRMKIAIDAAKGLAYLHEDCIPKIIHRDVKSSNILLGVNFEAKVGDFGLAKLTTGADQTHISTRVMGTFGYLAPEYASTGKLTEKSDVFSYGVMLLELITGRPPVFGMHGEPVQESLVDLARPLLAEALESNNYIFIVDPQLEKKYDFDEMKRMVACAAACVRHSAQKRPQMGQVVRVLDRAVSLEELNCGVTPGRSVLFDATAASQDES